MGASGHWDACDGRRYNAGQAANAVVRELQEEKQVSVRRGAIEILSRDGLHRRACSCYDSIDRHFGDIIGDSGNGGSNGCD